MLHHRTSYLSITALLLGILPVALAAAHGNDHGARPGIDEMLSDIGSVALNSSEPPPLTYFRLSEHSGWIYGHIAIMTITWTIFLPLATMFSVGQSRFALPSQVIFLLANTIGLVLGIVYNTYTPDLYEANAHHKVGWVFTWFAGAWVVLGVLNMYGNRPGKDNRITVQQMSIANMTQSSRLEQVRQTDSLDRRWSGDSGQGTERKSGSLFGSDSPGTEANQRSFDEQLPLYVPNDIEHEHAGTEKRGISQHTKIVRFLSKNVQRLSRNIFAVSKVIYVLLERLLVVFGFVALLTGLVTFGGVFHGSSVLNGLAHWVKGGIFFWYGLLTLGRWMGSFADFGWAWNVKPGADMGPRWKLRIPSAEFVESFVIALYGITNVWMEHLAAWGSAWHPEDLQHLALTFLFFFGGVLGMLVESKQVRELLSAHIIDVKEEALQDSPTTFEEEMWRASDNAHVPLNPVPALVILLLGIMMSSHTQESMVSSMLHKQWGQLFVFYAVCRGLTYLLVYLKPYRSYLPSRPPTELVAAFCLIGGGIVFMASARDIVESMEYNHLDAMFVFTVTMGLTALIMAWVIVLLAIKGWAVRKEQPRIFNRSIRTSQHA